MKKILMILAVLFFVGVVASTFISFNLNASDPSPDVSTKKPAKDPHSHFDTKTLCYNLTDKDCGSS